MHYLTGMFIVILSLGLSQASKASGPGYDSPLYDIDNPEPTYNTQTSGSGGYDNMESIRQSADGFNESGISNNIDKNLDVDEIINSIDNADNISANNTGALKIGCETTPDIIHDNVTLEPIKKSNNLIRKSGSALRAKGQYIILHGQVLDNDCLPISDAVIQIWQTDSAGNYLEAYRKNSNWDVTSPDYDKNFAYSGTAKTNNLGEYNFITILPVAKEYNRAPHINMIVRHPDFKNASTAIYFNKHPKNNRDYGLSKITEYERTLLLAKGKPLDSTGKVEGRQYDFNITLEGINKFRRY